VFYTSLLQDKIINPIEKGIYIRQAKSLEGTHMRGYNN